MNKSEKKYLTSLINDNNRLIQNVYDKKQLAFMTTEQREAFILGVSVASECFAMFLNMKVISVDINNIYD